MIRLYTLIIYLIGLLVTVFSKQHFYKAEYCLVILLYSLHILTIFFWVNHSYERDNYTARRVNIWVSGISTLSLVIQSFTTSNVIFVITTTLLFVSLIMCFVNLILETSNVKTPKQILFSLRWFISDWNYMNVIIIRDSIGFNNFNKFFTKIKHNKLCFNINGNLIYINVIKSRYYLDGDYCHSIYDAAHKLRLKIKILQLDLSSIEKAIENTHLVFKKIEKYNEVEYQLPNNYKSYLNRTEWIEIDKLISSAKKIENVSVYTENSYIIIRYN